MPWKHSARTADSLSTAASRHALPPQQQCRLQFLKPGQLSRALWWPAHPTPEIFRLPKFEAPMQKLKNTTTRLKKQCPRKLAKGVVWCSVYTRVCLRRMFVGSCAYMHSAFWRSSPFLFSLSSLFQHLFRFFFPWRKVGGFRMAIVGVVCLHVCSTVVCVCLCGGMERVYLN